MKSRVPTFLIAGILILAGTPKANSISFDELQRGEQILNYYNGGYGSFGTGPGPNEGIIFDSAWIATPPDAYDGPGNSGMFSGTAVMNVPEGWNGLISFYYIGSATVQLYDELNGGGNLLGTWYLPQASEFNPAGWEGFPAFYSAVFSSSGDVYIDAMGNDGPVLPEPGTAQLFLLGFVGVFSLTALRRRRCFAGERFTRTPPGHRSDN